MEKRLGSRLVEDRVLKGAAERETVAAHALEVLAGKTVEGQPNECIDESVTGSGGSAASDVLT
ncbi:hypothetical protein GCM10009788_54420 [Nocardioides humi]|uniref:Uncharacterized protein n=1 Tax=Nocardioides humi TaxID=449461 RepID=A0ABN2BQJ7_9ACTN